MTTNTQRPRPPSGFVPKRDEFLPLPPEPWMPAPYDPADIGAIKALARGEAEAHQQQRAVAWILYACGIHDLNYAPNSAQDTAFAAGRRWPALQMLKLMRLTVKETEQS